MVRTTPVGTLTAVPGRGRHAVESEMQKMNNRWRWGVWSSLFIFLVYGKTRLPNWGGMNAQRSMDYDLEIRRSGL
ncbi:hypothetical protein jhhlp_006086 [Lomentospora prolificans]|uniref:Uncharacterized protein n=1 Tax=Lomentospora prolificans TaxID=41688 RepID=A0A2N3N529_9PEZI|nr:hypothetical protein jhhlp_006086 [Lomentospora prolificans]